MLYRGLPSSGGGKGRVKGGRGMWWGDLTLNLTLGDLNIGINIYLAKLQKIVPNIYAKKYAAYFFDTVEVILKI